jgi:hypothetical protein
LIDERREVIEAIIDLGHIPAGMEGFPAIDIEQFRYIKKVIDECDYYVLIVGGRYGSVAEDGISFTEKEYRYAVETGKVVIAFVIDAAAVALLPPTKLDTAPEVIEKLGNFKSDVTRGRLVRFWSDQNALGKGVMKSLLAAFEEFPGVGWVRATAQANEDVLAQINTLRIKNEELETENERLRMELSPKISDIASLDSEYLIRYSYFNRSGNKENTSVTLTWRQIFAAVAPKLALPKNPYFLTQVLETYLKDAKLVMGRSPDINSVSASQIRIQLVAYGLIREIQGQSTNGTLGEWVQITDQGKRVMLEELIVRESTRPK